MSMWYYANPDGQPQGPLSSTDLHALYAAGQLSSGTLVWRDGLEQWQPLSEFIEEISPVRASGHDGGTTFYQAAEPVHRSPDFDRPAIGSSALAGAGAHLARRGEAGGTGEAVYAGFWNRLGAYFVDAFISGLGAAILASIAGLSNGWTSGLQLHPDHAVAGNLLALGVAWLYFAGFESSRWQATPGKRLLGFKVTDDMGQRIGFARATGRFFGKVLSALPVLGGFVLAAFTRRKQALHDLMASTLVVDRWAFTPVPERQRGGVRMLAWALVAVGAALVALGTWTALMTAMALVPGTVTA